MSGGLDTPTRETLDRVVSALIEQRAAEAVIRQWKRDNGR